MKNQSLLQRLDEQEVVLRLQAEELQKQGAAIEQQFSILRAQFEELQVLRQSMNGGRSSAAPPQEGVDSGLRLGQNGVATNPEPGVIRPVAPKGMGEPAPRVEKVAQADSTSSTIDDGTNDEARPESERPMDQLLIDSGGILLPPGTLQIEPSIEYTHLSGNNVAINGFSVFDAIVIGTIRVDDLRRDIVTGSLTARYGLADRLQIEGRVPAVFRREKEIFGIGTTEIRERTVTDTNIGDIDATLSWQPIANKGLIPATVLRAQARFPTGTNPFEIERENIDRGGDTRLVRPPTGSGFYSVTPGANFVWRSDPLVYFGGADYGFNLAREFDGFGVVDPGDSFGWYAGFNFSVSDRISLSTSFVNRHTKKTTVAGIQSLGTASNDARLVFGTAIAGVSGRTLIASAAMGLTDQSPDFSITLSLPFTFSNVGKDFLVLPSADPAKLF